MARIPSASGHGLHTNTQMDAAVKACYDKWKLARLAKSPTFVATSPGIYAGQTITDGYHVQWGTADRACVSEGIGYGMLITVLMAGYDAERQGLLRWHVQGGSGSPCLRHAVHAAGEST
jgi:hypothetical protein